MHASVSHPAILVALALVIGSPAVADQPKSGVRVDCHAAADLKAVDVLRRRVQADRLYTSWAREECLSYYPEQCTPAYVDVAIRERHAGACLGDPNTGPVVDRFRVYRSGELQWFDHPTASYIGYKQFLARRAKGAT